MPRSAGSERSTQKSRSGNTCRSMNRMMLLRVQQTKQRPRVRERPRGARGPVVDRANECHGFRGVQLRQLVDDLACPGRWGVHVVRAAALKEPRGREVGEHASRRAFLEPRGRHHRRHVAALQIGAERQQQCHVVHRGQMLVGPVPKGRHQPRGRALRSMQSRVLAAGVAVRDRVIARNLGWTKARCNLLARASARHHDDQVVAFARIRQSECQHERECSPQPSPRHDHEPRHRHALRRSHQTQRAGRAKRLRRCPTSQDGSAQVAVTLG